ncbi:hypothetical protein N0V93_000326 [Gnomoniopsis smithogilvyi]|uniref:Uncharacterized protein n=1 Tax=Gnomoniopsis smithogilvyi TaxID=1191159 RepID=A0A9W9D195_9PEZI|nr:hypothetical protein N0V93_000326 [Gnomoniopsis smithogilvyi]
MSLECFTSQQSTMASNKGPTSEFPVPQGGGDLYDNTIDKRPVPEDKSESCGSDYDPGVPGTANAANHDISRRIETAAATEIGDPDSRIPSGTWTKQQLSAAKNSHLPVEASRNVPNSPPSDAALHSAARENRKSNYAPGFEGAFDAVPQRSYNASGHEPKVLPHEKLESGNRA